MNNRRIWDRSANGCPWRRWMLALIPCILPLYGCGGSPDDGVAVDTSVTSPTVETSTGPQVSDATTASAPPSKQASSVSQGPQATRLTAKLKFKTGNGDEAFSIKPQDDGAKLIDSDDKELARFKLDGSKLKIKDADDVVLGYIVATDDHYKIKDAKQEVELWKLQRQQDGDWKLKNGQDELVYKIKPREYGFEILDPAEATVFKAKLKEGKTSLRDRSEKTVYSSHDKLPTVAMTCLGFEAIDGLPIRAALMTMLILDGRQ